MVIPPDFGNEPTIMSRCSRLQLCLAGAREGCITIGI